MSGLSPRLRADAAPARCRAADVDRARPARAHSRRRSASSPGTSPRRIPTRRSSSRCRTSSRASSFRSSSLFYGASVDARRDRGPDRDVHPHDADVAPLVRARRLRRARVSSSCSCSSSAVVAAFLTWGAGLAGDFSGRRGVRARVPEPDGAWSRSACSSTRPLFMLLGLYTRHSRRPRRRLLHGRSRGSSGWSRARRGGSRSRRTSTRCSTSAS